MNTIHEKVKTDSRQRHMNSFTVSVGRKAPRVVATNSIPRNSYPSSGRPQVSASLASKPSGPQALLNVAGHRALHS